MPAARKGRGGAASEAGAASKARGSAQSPATPEPSRRSRRIAKAPATPIVTIDESPEDPASQSPEDTPAPSTGKPDKGKAGSRVVNAGATPFARKPAKAQAVAAASQEANELAASLRPIPPPGQFLFPRARPTAQPQRIEGTAQGGATFGRQAIPPQTVGVAIRYSQEQQQAAITQGNAQFAIKRPTATTAIGDIRAVPNASESIVVSDDSDDYDDEEVPPSPAAARPTFQKIIVSSNVAAGSGSQDIEYFSSLTPNTPPSAQIPKPSAFMADLNPGVSVVGESFIQAFHDDIDAHGSFSNAGGSGDRGNGFTQRGIPSIQTTQASAASFSVEIPDKQPRPDVSIQRRGSANNNNGSRLDDNRLTQDDNNDINTQFSQDDGDETDELDSDEQEIYAGTLGDSLRDAAQDGNDDAGHESDTGSEDHFLRALQQRNRMAALRQNSPAREPDQRAFDSNIGPSYGGGAATMASVTSYQPPGPGGQNPSTRPQGPVARAQSSLQGPLGPITRPQGLFSRVQGPVTRLQASGSHAAPLERDEPTLEKGNDNDKERSGKEKEIIKEKEPVKKTDNGKGRDFGKDVAKSTVKFTSKYNVQDDAEDMSEPGSDDSHPESEDTNPRTDDEEPFSMLTFSVQRPKHPRPQGFQLRFYDSWVERPPNEVVCFNFGRDPPGPPDERLAGIQEGGLRKPGQPIAISSVLDHPMPDARPSGDPGPSTAGLRRSTRKRGRDVTGDEVDDELQPRNKRARPRTRDSISAYAEEGPTPFLNDTIEPEPYHAVHLGRILLCHDPRGFREDARPERGYHTGTYVPASTRSAVGHASADPASAVNAGNTPHDADRQAEQRSKEQSSIWKMIPGLQSLCSLIGGAYGCLSSVVTSILNLPSDAWSKIVNLAFRIVDPEEGRQLRTGAFIVALAIGVFTWRNPGAITPVTTELDFFEQSDILFQLYSAIPPVLLFGELNIINSVRATYDLGPQLNLGGLPDGPFQPAATSALETTAPPWDVNAAGDYVQEHKFIDSLFEASTNVFATQSFNLARWFTSPLYPMCMPEQYLSASTVAAHIVDPGCLRYNVPNDIKKQTDFMRNRITLALMDFRREHNKLMNRLRSGEQNSFYTSQAHLRRRKGVIHRVNKEAHTNALDGVLEPPQGVLGHVSDLLTRYGPLAPVHYAGKQPGNHTAQGLLDIISCHSSSDAHDHRIAGDQCQGYSRLPNDHFKDVLPVYQASLGGLIHTLGDFRGELRDLSDKLGDFDATVEASPPNCQAAENDGHALRICSRRELNRIASFLEDIALPRLRQMDERASVAARIFNDAEDARVRLRDAHIGLTRGYWTSWFNWMTVDGFGFSQRAFPPANALLQETEIIVQRLHQAKRLLDTRLANLASRKESSYNDPYLFKDCVTQHVPVCYDYIGVVEEPVNLPKVPGGVTGWWRKWKAARAAASVE